MDVPRTCLMKCKPIIETTDHLKYFKGDGPYVRLTALFILQLRIVFWSSPGWLLFGLHKGWW